MSYSYGVNKQDLISAAHLHEILNNIVIKNKVCYDISILCFMFYVSMDTFHGKC
jgi:hypothetical protein